MLERRREMIKGKREDVRKKEGRKIQVRKEQKHYKKPQLIEYGHIVELTQGPSGNFSDGPGGGRSRTPG
jgi:hypothetical protein